MQTIDVHDLPESVAQAIAAMVQSLRHTDGGRSHMIAGGRTVGETLAPIYEEAASLACEAGSPLQGEEAQVADLIVEKFRRQGLKL